ncbi:4-(cytidine 5'-diphospho)-2-C-methyl-D-erythritol kinase [Rosettibacter firmus]|uniref:4-(cytidine 5'-diphospho)-2-C-methyl-D-erythritol kinase n=1 Tax=Rosettibacter firmus TaxID=3111522 RepID=UPI00336BB2AC
MRYIEIKAPAKINIGLRVLEKRNDGYHNIYTLFYPIKDLYDTITFELSEKFEFNSNLKITDNEEENLIIKAKNLLEKFYNKRVNVKINLIKRIPIGAGLGGGSSDAAATLICLNELFNLGLSYEELIKISLELGSDIPFFLKALPAIGKGRGENLELITIDNPLPVLIVNPKIHISTKEAYESIIPEPDFVDYKQVLNNNLLNYELMKEKIVNDFEKIIFEWHPEIKEIKEDLYKSGAVYASMSGTGSTVFGFFEDYTKAQNAMNRFPREYFCWISNPLD